MEHSSALETDKRSSGQGVLAFYGARRYTTVFTTIGPYLEAVHSRNFTVFAS